MKISHVVIYGVSKWHFKPYFGVAQTFRQTGVPWNIEKSGMFDMSFYLKNLNAYIYRRKISIGLMRFLIRLRSLVLDFARVSTVKMLKI